MRTSLMSKQKGQSPSNPAAASTQLTTAIPTHSSAACKRVISLGRDPHPNELLPSMQREAKDSQSHSSQIQAHTSADKATSIDGSEAS
ncbi:hypothetical protein NC652_002402 [Populus alba x Populus x berolinensis]|nr:hypothetical protein NC652_002402 [Populus alba x Populus x berolinensis]